jgi:hypothetical protein
MSGIGGKAATRHSVKEANFEQYGNYSGGTLPNVCFSQERTLGSRKMERFEWLLSAKSGHARQPTARAAQGVNLQHDS